MKPRIILISLVALMLSACGPQAVRPDLTPTARFHLPISWEVAYQRADRYAYQCHGEHHWMSPGFVHEQKMPASKIGVVRTSGALGEGPEWEYIKVRAREDGSGTQVTISERETNAIGRRNMGAAIQSIVTGEVVCPSHSLDSWQPTDAPVPLNMSGSSFE